jgi:hypothetical protein
VWLAYPSFGQVAGPPVAQTLSPKMKCRTQRVRPIFSRNLDANWATQRVRRLHQRAIADQADLAVSSLSGKVLRLFAASDENDGGDRVQSRHGLALDLSSPLTNV